MTPGKIPRTEQIISEIRSKIALDPWREENVSRGAAQILPFAAPAARRPRFGDIVAAIAREIGVSTAREARPIGVDLDLHNAEVRKSAAALKLLDDADAAAAEKVGACPPSPPTARGRFSARVIEALSKLLWWQSFNVREALLSIVARNREQTRAWESAQVAFSDAILSSMKTLEAQQKEFLEEVGQAGSRSSRLENMVKSLQHRLEVSEREQRSAASEQAIQFGRELKKVAAGIEDEIGRIDSAFASLRNRLDSTARNEHSEAMRAEIARVAASLSSLELSLPAQFARVEALVQSDIGRLNSRTGDLDSRIEDTRSLAERAQAMASAAGRSAGNAISQLDAAKTSIEGRLDASAEAGRANELQSSELQSGITRVAESLSHLDGKFSDFGLFSHNLRAELKVQETRINRILREVRSGGAPAPVAPDSPATEFDLSLARVYLDFEDTFRGPRDEIRDRVGIYIPMIKQAGAGSHDRLIADLGCGRGEWLELLRSVGLEGVGADKNRSMVDTCRDLGLNILESGALEFLRSRPDSSLGAITSFHMIEHLPFPDVVALIDEALRVLCPGGLLVLETPNPGNIAVGASNFYLDPTHIRPIPYQTLRFFAEARGFCDVQVLELHPFPDVVKLPEDHAVGRRFNECFYGPQDYCLSARRP